MNIQDVKNILTIMEEKSINKAAAKLYIAQPSLSKCVKKVEKEYDITLFIRSQGSTLILTEQGTLFMEMAKNIMHSYETFEGRIAKLKFQNKNNIIFGITMQRAYSLSGPIVKWIYDHHPGYYMELRTLSTPMLEEELSQGNLDVVMHANPVENPDFYVREVFHPELYIYLRKGCGLKNRAESVPGVKYPILQLRDLTGEMIATNFQGSGGRTFLDTIAQQNGVTFQCMEQPSYSIRIAMVDAGYASTFITDEGMIAGNNLDQSRIFALPPEQSIHISLNLVCRRGFETDLRFIMIYDAVRNYYESTDVQKT